MVLEFTHTSFIKGNNLSLLDEDKFELKKISSMKKTGVRELIIEG